MSSPLSVDRLDSTALPAGELFFDALAEAILERCADELASGDLSSLLVLVPALPLAAELLAALRRAAPRPLLLPRFDTLTHWAGSVAASDAPLPDSERLVLLHEALRERGWFDESALWGIAAEMADLFDELTAAALALPDDAVALEAQLQRAYDLRACAPLAFEARVVHELWRALASAGRLDAAATYRLRLAALAAQPGDGARRPLLVLLDAPPAESLDPAEREFLARYGAAQPLYVFHPLPREAGGSPLLATLAAAWPEPAAPATLGAPLRERAQTLQMLPSALAGRLQLVATEGREQEALAAVAQVGQWLADGLRRIVLIAQDRLTARRVRALLEREGVLVSDETGWTLSTSRAAASIDALLETVAGGAYYRDLLDLCKSPYVFADVDEGERKAAVYRLEAALRAASVRSGLSRMRRALLEFGSGDQHGADRELAQALLDRVGSATALLNSRPAPLARWIERLLQALELLGAQAPLRQDAAGQTLLDLLALRGAELAGSSAIFSFTAWRDWLNRQFEAATFRDATIASTIVLTPLNAVCLRRFDAALLLGGDARQLAPVAGGDFFNQSVRRELGLRTRDDGERELRRDLELLLATVPRVTVTWQSMHDGEANLLAPEFALLSTLHLLAWGDDLRRPPLPARGEAPLATAPVRAIPAAPVALPTLIPQRVSVSGYASLVACPYRFFARHVLRLGEMDEVAEEMAKSDYGALVHRVLERFHERHPVLSQLPEDEALSALQRCVEEVFAAAVADNFLATGWRLRWEQRLPAYLDWQRELEAQGWRWAQAETKVSRMLPLAAGDEAIDAIELYGRIDRVDQRADGAVALFDYKTQNAKAIRDRLPDDVQLPAYALLYGGNCAQAAYVALDDEAVVTVASGGEDLMDDAQAQGRRLQNAFTAMRGGARLPAHGVDSVCAWCEMSGLCRRDHV
ncbi:MAG: Inactivated superfamily helicase [Proteobacteria bacterium]|nr:Inactivated superfamily helicase [Pseudomonadota bacterium]